MERGDNTLKLKNKVKNLSLMKNVEFTGYLTEEEKANLLAKAWIFVTMAEKEGWGITVIEANAVYTPAIGADVPRLRDSIIDGETGYLVPLGDEKMLAEKIKQLILNKNELSTISKKAHIWSKKYSRINLLNTF